MDDEADLQKAREELSRMRLAEYTALMSKSSSLVNLILEPIFPLVNAICRDQAAPLLHRLTEHWLLRCRLAYGINRLRTN
jgi:hypothetical protein